MKPKSRPLDNLHELETNAASMHLVDSTWVTINDASAALLSETEPVPSSSSSSVTKRTRKTTTQSSSGAVKRERAPDVKVRTEIIPMPDRIGADGPPVFTMEQHTQHGMQAELFAQAGDRPMRATNDMLVVMPSVVDTLQYSKNIHEQKIAFERVVRTVAARNAITFPQIPLMSRAVLITFLREPDAKNSWERPCLNLDREPEQHERAIRCVAHRLSAELLGYKNAFRCRELMFPAEMYAVNRALEPGSGVDPRSVLPAVPEFCYMCHVYLTTGACHDLQNRTHHRDLTSSTANDPQQEPEVTHIANRFMVSIDVNGEYRHEVMLAANDVSSLGIWGPFPEWNKRNYIACRVKDLRAFEEHDRMVFRLPRVSSHQITQEKTSNSFRFDPTSAAQAATRFPK